MDQDDLSKLLVRIGKRVKALREEEDISQLDLGVIVGLSSNHIGRIERAEVNPTIKSLHGIATHYKVGIRHFIDEEEDI